MDFCQIALNLKKHIDKIIIFDLIVPHETVLYKTIKI